MTAARRPRGSKTPAEPFVADFSEGLETGLYLALLELIDEGLIITGDEFILDVNTAACRLLERDYRELAGAPLTRLFRTEQAFLEARERLFINGQTRGQLQVALPHGGQRTLRFIAAARLRPGVHALILSPEAADEPLPSDATRADSLWPRLAAALEQPVIVVDDAGLVSAANAMALRTLAVERAELVGKPLGSRICVDWPDAGAAPIASVYAPDAAYSVRARVLTGPRPGWRVLVLPPAAAVNAGTDGLANTSPSVAAGTSRFFEHAFAESPLPTFLCEGPQLKIFAANAAAMQSYGRTHETLCALAISDLRAKEQPAGASGVHRGAWRHARSDGSPFDVVLDACPIEVTGRPDAVVLVHQTPNAARAERPRLTADIIEAAAQSIDGTRLEIYYQPLIDTRDSTIRSGEALLHWDHPVLGPRPFRRFMRVAGSGCLPAGLRDKLLVHACAAAARWPETNRRRPGLTINIATCQLLERGFTEHVRRALQETGLPGAQLELDLEERLLGEDNAHLQDTLRALHALGVRLAIDGFGQGLSSIPRLKRYPLTTLKLHPRLVCDVGKSEENEAIVEAIVSMASVLGLEVLARGVKSRAQQAFLTALGCHLQQGPLFGEPMTAQAFCAQQA